MEHWPTISEDHVVQAAYERMRGEGTSHALAEMFAMQVPPMSNSDREFLEGHVNGSQFSKDEKLGNAYKRVAKRFGVSTHGKVYQAGLARFPGDPEAWISSRGEAQALLEKRGWGSEGAINVKARSLDEPPPPPPRLAPDIVKENVDRYLAADPALAMKPRQEVEEMVIDKHGAPK